MKVGVASSLPVPFVMKAKTTVSPPADFCLFFTGQNCFMIHCMAPVQACYPPLQLQSSVCFPSRVLGSEKGIGVRMVLRSSHLEVTDFLFSQVFLWHSLSLDNLTHSTWFGSIIARLFTFWACKVMASFWSNVYCFVPSLQSSEWSKVGKNEN